MHTNIYILILTKENQMIFSL